MENIKIKLLGFLSVMINVLLIVSVITFVLSGVITAFYAEFEEAITAMGWSQERFAWLTVSAGSLGTLGLLSTRLTGTLRSAIILAKQDNNSMIATNQRLNETKFETQQRINEQLRSQMQLSNDANMDELRSIRKELATQNKFNELQAKKYTEAPDSLVDPKLKDEYRDFINKSKKV